MDAPTPGFFSVSPRLLAFVFLGAIAIGAAAAAFPRPFSSNGEQPWFRRAGGNSVARAVPFVGQAAVDQAYADAEAFADSMGDERAAVVFVPHHLLAKDLIAKSLHTQQTGRKRTVVLLSPNHFSAGIAPVIFSQQDWRAFDGVVTTDRALVARLAEAVPNAAIDEAPFEEEHGVYNIVPFIKRSMPDAKLVSLMIKDSVPAGDAKRVAAALNETLPPDALLVASFDFSHEQHDISAEFHDQTALEVLRTLDVAGAASVDIDSRPGLAVAMEFARLRGAGEFRLFASKNSVDYTGNASQTDVTSYIAGAYVSGEPAVSEAATILAFGDLMLNRDVRPQLQLHGNAWPFEPMRRFLSGSDITLANLEGTITTQEPKRLEPESILFTFDPSVAPTLSWLGFDLFSLANNHSRDFGPEGFAETKKILDASGLEYFGDFFNRDGVSNVVDVRGQRLAFVGVHTVYGRDPARAIEEVERLQGEADAVIVMAHWGEEYKTTFSSAQRKLAHALVDAGADIVIGAHPHVVQPMEVYEGKPIFYSLGNFVFDQQFSQDVRNGLAVGLRIGRGEVECFLFPHSISPRFQVGLVQPNQAAVFYKQFAQNSAVPEAVKADMADGRFTLPRS